MVLLSRRREGVTFMEVLSGSHVSQCLFDRSVSTNLFAAYWVTTVQTYLHFRYPCTLACWDLPHSSVLPAFFPALSFDNQSLDRGNAFTPTLRG